MNLMVLSVDWADAAPASRLAATAADATRSSAAHIRRMMSPPWLRHDSAVVSANLVPRTLRQGAARNKATGLGARLSAGRADRTQLPLRAVRAFRAPNGTAALAPTAALPEATPNGALPALFRRPSPRSATAGLRK